ncbi:MAG TPA: ADOP family duplicated permease [Gemmatimonadaceae bacterium]|jgi:putative ABC transport system permease protein
MLRKTVRALARNKGLTAAAVVTLAAGTAALTLTFGVVDGALWREPPFQNARQVVIVNTVRTAPNRGAHTERWSYGRIRLIRESAASLDQIANFGPSVLTLTGAGDPEPVQGEIVSPEYFPLLNATAWRGRLFSAADDSARAARPVAILGFDLWRRRFGGDPNIVGSSVLVNGAPLVVIGIAPRGFRGLSDRAELWIPTAMAPSLTYAGYVTTNQNFISVAARVRPGVPLPRVNAELATLGARINAVLPPNDPVPGETISATAVPLNAARVDDGTRRSLLVLLGAVALLWLLACANVVNLLLGRATARRQEAAIRSALGATGGQLAVHYGAEALVLAGLGGIAGVTFATWAARFVSVPANVWFARNFFGSIGTFDASDTGIRLAACGAVIAAVTALLVAGPPALAFGAIGAGPGLSVGARAAATGGGSLKRPSARGVIVALETALAMLLVVAGGLMVESFARIRHAEVGIQSDHLLTFWVRPSEVRVPPRDAPAFVARILDAIERVPGVIAASVDGGTPLSGSASSTLVIVGRPVPANLDDAPPVDRHYVGPNHFRALGTPLVRGRTFTDADDANHPRVAIISETAARRFWPGQDPIGERVWFGGGSNFDRPDSSATIVGIVGDVADEPLDGHTNRASFYTPYRQFTFASRAVFVRTAGDPLAVVPAIRAAVASAAPGLPLYDVQTMEQRMTGSWAQHEFDAALFGTFGGVALLLAALGTYAVVAYSVARRTREMGIRLALGARPKAIVWLVLRDGLTFPAIGVGVGTGAALAATALLRGSLYGVGPTDPRVFGVTAVVLTAFSMLACVVPAARATRADPLTSLRVE